MESPDGPKYCLYCLDLSLESFCSRDWKRDGDCGRQRDTASNSDDCHGRLFICSGR